MNGLLLATPEYNNSIPGVFKNAVDWLSRPPADIGRVFGGKPVGLLGASPGGFGTVLSQSAWLPVLRTLGTRPWFGGRLLVARAAEARNPEDARKTFDLLGSRDKELFWIENTTRRFKDGYNYFGRRPEKAIAFFDKHMK